MKLNIRHLNVPRASELQSLIKERLASLEPRLQIDEARVRIECREESSPAFRVQIHLVIPGPDVKADRSDHTITAALDKVMADVEATIAFRDKKRHQQARSNLQKPAVLRMSRR